MTGVDTARSNHFARLDTAGPVRRGGWRSPSAPSNLLALASTAVVAHTVALAPGQPFCDAHGAGRCQIESNGPPLYTSSRDTPFSANPSMVPALCSGLQLYVYVLLVQMEDGRSKQPALTTEYEVCIGSVFGMCS
jgi:hypothetical protein